MYCKYCGARIKDGSRFCPKCGQPQSAEAAEVAEAAAGLDAVESPAPESAAVLAAGESPVAAGSASAAAPAPTPAPDAAPVPPADAAAADDFMTPVTTVGDGFASAEAPAPDGAATGEAYAEVPESAGEDVDAGALEPGATVAAAPAAPDAAPVSDVAPAPEATVPDAAVAASEPASVPEFAAGFSEPTAVGEPAPAPESATSTEPDPAAAPAPDDPFAYDATTLMGEPPVIPVDQTVAVPVIAPDAVAASTPAPITSTPAAVRAAAAADPRRRRRRRIVVGIVAVVLLALIGTGGYLWYQADQARQADEALRSEHDVSIPLTVTSFDTSTGSKLPVHVTGTNADGKVDETQFVDDTGTGLKLARGTYELTFPASPIAADGTLYSVPTGKASLKIGDDVQPHEKIELTSKEKLEVKPVDDPSAVTDERLDAAKKYAAMKGACGSGVNHEEIVLSAVNKRDQAVAQKQQEEAAKKAEEEKKKAEEEKAKYHVETNAFTFDVPKYWYGRVTVKAEEGGLPVVHVYSSKYPNREIVRIEATQGLDNDLYAQYHDFGSVPEGDFAIAAKWTNYGNMISAYARQNSTDPSKYFSQDEAEELVDLQTGGEADYQRFYELSGTQDINGERASLTQNGMESLLAGTVQIK